ncbi:glycosyl hydrolase [Leptospira langatensis]|uniref:Glycosyl hydrolase n=1 Tax=Leptospira langatensis TaxID=2484983 RepID=A0A5F1ZUI4_9LEPT|nr:putative glycoside hydrolase [Leptospira langatensis]TGK00344.1 glycosyl hydrolase [Leptospira langatensis]TGL41109.1 glycosyl hydrolase [Leptospira langatensis]
MRKPFSLLPLLITIAFPVCAEFTIPFPENARKKEVPPIESSREERVSPRTVSIKEKEKKEAKLASRNVTEEAAKERERETSLPKIQRTRPRTGNQTAGPIPPRFYRGLYVNNSIISDKKSRKKWETLLQDASDAGINVLVIDLQPFTLSASEVARVKELGFYPVGRLVNFEGGLKTELPSQDRMNSILNYVRKACASGFPEIQLDYIRYADITEIKIPLKQKYKNISGVIDQIRTEANQCEKLPYLGADIFGRIPFNKDDQIGQKVENFAQAIDVIYPMLYPSHFYGQPSRIANPYQTIYDGLLNTKKRSLSTTRVVGWIQGFTMSIRSSGKSLKDYIKAQIEASVDSESDGFIVWNIQNQYEETFRAIRETIKDGKLKIED